MICFGAAWRAEVRPYNCPPIGAGSDNRSRDSGPVKDVLEFSGSTVDNVVACSVMVGDIEQWGDVNKVTGPTSPTAFPRGALGVDSVSHRRLLNSSVG